MQFAPHCQQVLFISAVVQVEPALASPMNANERTRVNATTGNVILKSDDNRDVVGYGSSLRGGRMPDVVISLIKRLLQKHQMSSLFFANAKNSIRKQEATLKNRLFLLGRRTFVRLANIYCVFDGVLCRKTLIFI